MRWGTIHLRFANNENLAQKSSTSFKGTGNEPQRLQERRPSRLGKAGEQLLLRACDFRTGCSQQIAAGIRQRYHPRTAVIPRTPSLHITLASQAAHNVGKRRSIYAGGGDKPCLTCTFIAGDGGECRKLTRCHPSRNILLKQRTSGLACAMQQMNRGLHFQGTFPGQSFHG